MADAARYAGMRVARVEDARLLTGHGTYVDDIVAARDAARVLRAQPVRPGRDPRHRHVGRARAARRARRVHRRRPQPRRPGAVAHVDRAAESRRRRARRSPRARCASSATRSRSSSPTSRYLAEDAAELVDVDYEPLPAVVDYTHGRATPTSSCTSATAPTSSARSPACPRRALDDVFAAAAHVVSETIYQQALRARCRWRPAASSSTTRAAPASSRSTRRRRRRTRCGCSARACSGMPEHRIRVDHARHRRRVRPEGHGPARRDVPDARGAEGRRAGEVDRGPAREPARRRAVAPRARRRRRWRSTPTARSRRAHIDFVPDCGAYPTPWPVMHRGRGRHAVPRPVPRAHAPASRRKIVYTNTVGRTAYRGPWQFETLAREVLLDIAARRMGIDPVELRRRNLLRRDELPYTNPNGMTYDSISPLETFEQALEMLDYDAFRAEQAEARTRRPLPRRRHRRTYVEPSTPGFGYYAHRGRDDPHRAVGHGQRVHRRRLDRQQPRDDRRPAHRRRARRRHRRRQHDPGRHRGHRLRRRHRRAAAAGR